MDAQKERKKFSVVASEYKLLEEVGQGVSATVYRAIWLPANEVVAIKSLDLEKCISNLDGIRKEAQMMSLISHPNVVKAYCSFVVDQSLWVVMPYMAGGSCLHIMKSAYPDGFEEAVIATFLKETLKALEYLHRHGHIHRDVKAGNILVDEYGAVKLGDFGVSACMFDTGDRQRSRNTFVGTPCWMAPEVMEQLHGYDFKADIWSFGITALELAHGHAPFSKYPPMKVLLMTLQNAPPGLDYERDKRFTRLFKEMIAMCLVKDPVKRPSAEKLLKHSFFKQAKNYEYIAKHVLEGLPPLGERVMNLKLKDAARLAQKKVPYGEQEERSQNEYKRGVSSWNFNVEDLKAQAAMNQDDDYNASVKEENEVPKGCRTENGSNASLPQPVPTTVTSSDGDLGRPQLPPTSHPVKAESTTDLGNRSLRPRSGPLSNAEHTTEAAGDRMPRARSGPLTSAGQPLKADFSPDAGVDRSTRPRCGPVLSSIHSKSTNGVKGRFDIFEEDTDLGSSNDSFKVSDQILACEREIGRRDRGDPRRSDDEDGWDEKDQRRMEEREPDRSNRAELDRSNREDHGRRLVGGTVGSERNLCRIADEDKDRDHHRQSFRSSDDLHWSHAQFRDRGLNGAISINKELLEEKLLKGGIVQKKGRFSITSEDVDAADVASHSSATSQSFPSLTFAATVPVAAIYPHLQTVLHHCAAQQEVIMHLMSSISPGDLSTSQILNHAGSKSFLRNASVASTGDYMMDASSEKEREHLQQLMELRSRVAHLVDELQVARLKTIHLVDDMNEVKLRNIQLEQQLKAVYNKEEEERIQKGSAAKEDG